MLVSIKRWKIFNCTLALKNSSSKNRCRWRLWKCYAHKHIIVDFFSIFKSLNVWISFKKNIFMRVIGWRIVVIIFKQRRIWMLRFNYIAIMNQYWQIVQWFTYWAIKQMKRAMNKVNNYSFYIINKLITLCRTKDTPIRTFKYLMMLDVFQWIWLSTFCVGADKLYFFEQSDWNRVWTIFLYHLICIDFI